MTRSVRSARKRGRRAAGVSVAQVARRYSMNTNLIHKWLRDLLFAPEEETCEVLDAAEVEFVPVEIADAGPVPPHCANPVSAPALTAPVSAQRVDITLSDGRPILKRFDLYLNHNSLPLPVGRTRFVMLDVSS